MARYALVSFILFLALSPAWAAGDLRAIEFTDGTTILAEIISVDDGIYTLRSKSRGEITIPASDIRVIGLPPSNRAPAPKRAQRAPVDTQPVDPPQPEDLGKQTEDLKRSLESDDETMEMIKSLQDDPEMQEVLSDPEIMRAVETNELGTLMSNPKFMKLLGNPKLQEIRRRSIKEQSGGR